MKKSDPGPSKDVPGGMSIGGTIQSMFDDTYVDPDETGNFVVIPPDGGWGWVIVIAAFICNMCCDGITFCFGIFLKEIAKDLKCSKTDVAITTSVLTATYYAMGPLFCAMTNRFGYRIICIVGSLIAISVFVSSAYAPNLYVFIVIMGAIGGGAFCMIYITSIIIVGFYFERWRAMATAIAVTGSAVGVIVMPQIIGLLSKFTWREQFLFLATAFVLTFLCGLTYRPLKPVQILEVRDDKELAAGGMQDTYTMRSIRSRGLDQTSLNSEGTERFTIGTGKGNRFHNKMFPTAAEAHGSGSFVFSLSSIQSGQRYKLKSLFPSDYTNISKLQVMNTPLYKRYCPCCFTTKDPRNVDGVSLRHSTVSRTKAVAATRPLYRDDVFYHGSLTGLQQYHGQSTSRFAEKGSARTPAYDYHMSVTRMITTTDVEEQRSEKCLCCPQSMKRILATMFDVNLLRQLSFTIFMISGFFTVVGLYVPYIYIVDMNVKNGVEEQHARFLLSVIGFANAIGRISCGLISLSPKLKPIICMEICLILCGISVVLLPFFPELWMQYCYITIFGLTNAANAALRSIIIVDLYGLENLTNAYGIAVLFQGLACCIGLPVSGVLKKKTGSYMSVMIFAGGNIVLSGILIIPVRLLNKRERRKAMEKVVPKVTEKVVPKVTEKVVPKPSGVKTKK